MSKPVLPKFKQRKIAEERIRRLFEMAEEIFQKKPSLAHRYVSLARKIALRVKLRIPRELKRRICSHCYKYLQPGVNARVRTRAGKVIISCFECKKFMRIPVR
ncbi:MAG TPA: ribonuclease P protein component 4 [Candidatus Nanoarchaeia archaeon]|nr:ribonuclease P protein component 4 [Candidatus Nanoarchaeia archaeon]